MKNKYTFARIFFTVFTVFTALAASVGLTMLYLKNVDLVDIDGVYQTALLKNNAATAAFIAFAVCTVVILALSGLVYRKASAPAVDGVPKNLTVFLNAACGLFIVAAAVMQFVLDSENTPYRIEALVYAMTALAIPAALYFLWPAFAGKCPKGLRMFFGISLAAWLCCTALSLHFFMNDFLNSPTRVVTMLSCCVLIFFFLADVRLDTPGLFVPLGLIAAFLAIPDGAGKVVLSFMRAAGFSPNVSAFYALCRLALGIYALVSVICYLFKAQDAKAVKDASEQEPGVPAENEETVKEGGEEKFADEAAEPGPAGAEGPYDAKEPPKE